ncbi:Calcium-independent phospholipase A2-gamma [Fusarium odoratissimum]|uniref:Calcium-independent phospholipase A2-gamma n=1 Tax=Fusarium oxysporum f. sp. cubense (strain race 4) TaxID=2502994 RepID=N1RXJ2_FUSC4|nr:Calcium-independent phospholipase A2-gamma [Fusarium odoratissimum]
MGLRILSLDGGGVKGYGSLLILRRIFRTMVTEGGLDKEPLPCEVFDLIVGTSTGGLIAIMLGRLRLSIDECLLQYEKTGKAVFDKPISQNKLGKMFKQATSSALYDINKLQEEIRILLASCNMEPDSQFVEDGRGNSCKVMVCVTRGINSRPDVLRSYISSHPTQENYKCSIWEAASATAAAPTFFDPVKLAGGELFCDGGMRRNNPIDEAVNELNRELERGWSGRSLGCLVSIGTGVVEAAKISTSVTTLIKAVVKILTDSEDTAEEFVKSPFGRQLESSGRYFRFNVPQGLQTLKLDEWKETEKLNAATTEYLSKSGTGNLRHFYQSRLREYFWNFNCTKPQIFVLWGLAGVGKTQLALKFAEMIKTRLKVFWIPADQPSNFNQSYAKLLPQIHPDRQLANAIQDLPTLLEETCSELEANPAGWLLVMDNTDDFDEYRQAMDPYLPKSGRILITSRDPRFQGDVATAEDGINVLPMEREESIELLTKSIPGRLRKIPSETEEAPSYLVNMLGNLPLAIAQAAANIRDQQVSLRDYIKLFHDDMDPSSSFRVPVRDRNARDPRNAEQSVNKTWGVSLNRLRESSPSTVLLLGYMSCLHWDRIPVDLMRKLPKFRDFSPIEFRRTIARALQLSLVQEHDLGRFSVLQMHPLVHGKQLARLMQVYSSYLNEFGDLKSALLISTRALNLATAMWGPHDISTFYVRKTKIDCLQNSQMYQKALEDIDRGLEYLQSARHGSMEEEVERLGEIGNLLSTKRIILSEMFDHQAALDVSSQAVDILTEIQRMGPQSPSVESAQLVARHNQAHSLHRLARFDEAEVLNLEVLKDSLRSDGSVKVDRRSYHAFLNLRGQIIADKDNASPNQHMEALEIFNLVFQATLATHGIGSLDTWVAVNNVLSALEALDGDSRVQLTSLELFETLFSLATKQGLPRRACHPEFQCALWTFLGNLNASLQLLQSPDFERLWGMRTEFVQVCKMTQELPSLYTAGRANAAGVMLQARGRFELAEAQHREALDVLNQLPEEALAAKNVRDLFNVSHYNIMLALARQGRVYEARIYRDGHRSDISPAEETYDALEVRLERDMKDKQVYDQTVAMMASGDLVPTDQWWLDHDISLQRAQKRYGFFIKPSGTTNLVEPQLGGDIKRILTFPEAFLSRALIPQCFTLLIMDNKNLEHSFILKAIFQRPLEL